MKDKKKIIIGSAILLVVIAVALGLTFYDKNKSLKPDQVKAKVENFVNNYLIDSNTPDSEKATVSDIVETYGLYKMKINLGANQTVDSYLSKDGKLFFPQALDVDKVVSEATGANTAGNNPDAATPVNVPKNDKPKVELFVMTHCPYGTQMEKGILPAISALGNKVDFEIKFNDYAMHGEKELDESLKQYCIQKEQESKYNEYLTCFLKSSDTASCLASTGIDTKKMDSCIAKTDKEYSVKENFKNKVDFKGTYPSFNVNKDDNAKYNVGGSPTLVINETEVSASRDSASLLKTICSAFNEAPEECNTVLSSASPSAGFGEGTTSGSAAADCGQ